MRPVVVDTGPLVAYFDRDDGGHAAIHTWFATRGAKRRLLTTEAVVTEVTHLLDFDVATQTAFLSWAEKAMQITSVSQAAYQDLATWMNGYAKVPMDFADATVLWLYQATPDAQILTLDQRGFGVFRLPGQARKQPAVVLL